jgi:D-3-phosphoglycerate dehydrogenase / 2-oxoglutarate reductase
VRLLITESEGFSPRAVQRVGSVASVQAADLDRPELLARIGGFDAIWVRLRHRIDRELLDRAPRLMLIATATTGLNHIDLDACEERGIQVICLRGHTAFLKGVRATGEHTIALMLAWLRNLVPAAQHVAAGGWQRDPFRGGELSSRTLGLVGYGRLGSMVGDLALAFGCRVLAHDPAVGEASPGVRLVDMQTLLAEADIVSVHVHLAPQTVGLIDAGVLARMKPGALLVNTSRGEILDEDAVLAALDSGRLGGLAADVLSGERSAGMEHHPLVARAALDPRVLLTPHIGGATWESMQTTEDFLADHVVAALRQLST